MIDTWELWSVIIALGLGSYAMRFSFLGLVGNRKMPDWLMRHLRYTAVSFLPALVAPLILWPSATGGETDPLRLTAGLATLAVGYLTRHVVLAMVAGASVMLAGAYWFS